MFHHVGQAGLELLTSSDLPASASQSTGITGVSRLTWPCKDVEHSDYIHITGEDVKWYIPITTLRSSWAVSLNVNTQLSDNLIIAFLGIYSRDMKTCSHKTCSPMFVAAFFIIDRNWEQHTYISQSESLHNLWYIHTVKYNPATKRSGLLILATAQQPEWISRKLCWMKKSDLCKVLEMSK